MTTKKKYTPYTLALCLEISDLYVDIRISSIYTKFPDELRNEEIFTNSKADLENCIYKPKYLVIHQFEKLNDRFLHRRRMREKTHTEDEYYDEEEIHTKYTYLCVETSDLYVDIRIYEYIKKFQAN